MSSYPNPVATGLHAPDELPLGAPCELLQNVNCLLHHRALETHPPRTPKRNVEESYRIDGSATKPLNSSITPPAKRVKALVHSHSSFDSALSAEKLICPFYMRDKHSQAISKSCMPPGYTSISRLKEHLKRCHTQPENQCNRCHETFKSADGLAAHQRSQVTCNLSHTRSPPGIMTTDQWDAVRSRKRSNMSTEEKWKSIYSILFPGDSHIPSPYKVEPCGTCITTADSRLLDEVEQHLVRELDSFTESESTVMTTNQIVTDIRARILAVCNSFRQPRNLDRATNSQIHVSSDSQPPEYPLEDIGRRTVSPEKISLPTTPGDEWLDDLLFE